MNAQTRDDDLMTIFMAMSAWSRFLAGSCFPLFLLFVVSHTVARERLPRWFLGLAERLGFFPLRVPASYEVYAARAAGYRDAPYDPDEPLPDARPWFRRVFS